MKFLKLFYIFILTSLVHSKVSFNTWQLTFKTVETASGNSRQIFDMNNAFITIINSRLKNSFLLGLNEFSDLTFGQFQNRHLGLVVPKTADRISSTTYSETMHSPLMSIMPTTDSSSTTVADSVDYSNYTLAVKHQLNCGSCWAFSVLDTLESRLKRLNNSYNTKLSPQYLVDCDTRDYACGGGWPINALNWIVQGGGNAVPAWTDYQYYGFKLRCRVTPKIHMGIVATVQNFTGGNENMMKELVSNYGPLTSVISVTSYFQLYKSGIFYDTTCNSNCATVNHAIVIVGYGRNVTTNMDYWIVKNSWGTSWGQAGYIFMARNQGNNCNIACYATYAV
ncbi:hypothetical protein ACKWTF_013841 [Chironomus riparius]